jgi:hypothetical protein
MSTPKDNEKNEKSGNKPHHHNKPTPDPNPDLPDEIPEFPVSSDPPPPQQ